ncbi:sn-glycerol-3-phosphate ABC transporter ATP-binding protein UgpC [Phyllobacterium sp. YR531]|uniref:ABC transporter ATP-binding protein n=1 Tax=Phyllobacterium sp. YR531 TaxID=1144343 RepID=UPI00026FBB24|nr:sn-glycerol-3-phosphate ABC transporter ATP-binding protein UgpC [Phyllobacterium sp. YR531]EJN02317.1 ATPase component of ABC-type sugar transporter [Phyllobacterium sp. YR531]
MAEVTLTNTRKSYGNVDIIHGIDLDIEDGQFVVLVGPSGCGKSTLLRMVAGLETISSGEVAIGGRVVNDIDPKDRDIAMVFQNYALYPHMTVATNMGFSLEHRGTSKSEISERVNWAAGILGLTPLLDRYPRQLSGGQRQRVAMGRAIVRSPQVFLFDEPLSNLDAKLRVVMRGEIKALHDKLRTTMIYVTHDQVEAMTMADKIVVLNAGRIEQSGTPLELYDRPANRFVAGFIGSPAMNFISGKVHADGLAVSGITIPLPEKAKKYIGDDVTVGIRPEHLTVEEGGLAAQVLLVEPMGHETQITVQLADNPITGLFRERLALQAGSGVKIGFKTEALHMFSAKDGHRLE